MPKPCSMFQSTRITVVAAFEAMNMQAHVLNTVRMAGAFAALGHRVTVVCKRSAGGRRLDPVTLAAAYGLPDSVRWRQVPTRVGRREVGLHWYFGWFALAAILGSRPHLVFSRNYVVPYLTARLGLTTVAESHAHPGTDRTTPAFGAMVAGSRRRAFRALVTISPILADYYAELGVPREKIIILADAVDLNCFMRPAALPPSPYPVGRPVVAYVGHLYDYKGIPTILDTAARLPEADFHLVGGLPEDVERQRRRVAELGLSNVTLHGLKSPREVPPYLWHASVLLLPPSANHPSAAWTSPMKLGEYLASGTPVVATAIPALRYWVTERDVQFVRPDDPNALAAGVRAVLADSVRATTLRAAGATKAVEFSYVRRAQAVLEVAGLKLKERL